MSAQPAKPMNEKQKQLQQWLKPGNGLTPTLVQEVLAASRDETDLEFVAAAKRLHHSEDDQQVDDTALVNQDGDRDGAWVQTWIWVNGYETN